MKSRKAVAASDTAPRGLALPIALSHDRSRRGLIGKLQMAGLLLLLATIASIPLVVGLGTWFSHQAMRKEWTMKGAACPIVPAISIAAQGAKPPPPFVFQGVAYAFQIGDVFCEAVPEGYFKRGTYPVCQFDAPGAVEVTTGGGKVIFEPGVGHHATVTVRRGKTSCVVGGWF
jgi:hypothetical protein